MATITSFNCPCKLCSADYDLFELKLDFLQELESFVKDVSIFGVISVAKVHYSTSITTGAELQTHISQPQLTRKHN
jgi:hypothetical protein